MISSVCNWFTNQKITMIAAGMACAGFIGPGLFDLSPPKYFVQQSMEVERGGVALGSSAPSMVSFEPSTPVPKKMVEPLKLTAKTHSPLRY